MELQKVREVAKISAGSEHCKNKKNENKKQWSIQFIELLLREFEAEEEQGKAKGREAYQRQTAGDEEDQEADCRIVAKGEEPVPEDWDSFEMTVDWTEPVLTCELYEDIIDHVRMVGNWRANIIYKIADAVMGDYYRGAFDAYAVVELFCGCYEKCVEKNKEIATSVPKRRKVLEKLYEYFARANARKSVSENEREGRKLIEQCGLTWAGTTYYNARHYYACEDMKRRLGRASLRLAARERMGVVSLDEIERRTQFAHVGGVSFHGVFVWLQQKDNHPGGQYGMKDLLRVPPRQFVYLYRNHFAENEEMGIRLLESCLKSMHAQQMRQLWRSFTLGDGREYHNGMSYLLEGSLMDECDEAVYGAAMGFLQNFILYRISGCAEFLSAGEWRTKETEQLRNS